MNLERPGAAPLRRSTKIPHTGATPKQTENLKRDARAVYNARMGELAKRRYKIEEELPAVAFSVFVDWFDQNVAVHKRSFERAKSMHRQLVAEFASTPIAEIDQARVREWMTRRRQTVEATTVNRELDELKVIFAAAVPKYLAASPLVGLRRLRGQETDIRILTREEYDRLLQAASDEEAAVLVTAVNTLLRLGSLEALEWRHDKGTHFVTLNAKVSQVLAPINRAVRQALDRLPRSDREKYIFAPHAERRGGGPRARETYLIRQFAKLCARAHVSHGRDAGGVTFHSLRHTGATWALEKTGNIKAVMALGGWKTMPVCLRYVHALTGDVVAAAEGITEARP